MSRSHTALICLLGVSLLAPVWCATAGVRSRSGMTVQPVGGQTQDTQASGAQPNSDPQLNDDKYGVIPDRNVFKLKPLPLPVDPNKSDKPPDPPVKVTLTGITTILGDALAILEVQPPGGKPKIFLTLAEGERSGDVAVVTINQKASTVTIKNQDITQTLDMGEAAKRAGGTTGTATVGGSGLPMIPPAGGDSRPRSIPTRRDMRVTSSGDNSSNPNSNPNSGNGSSGLTTSGNGSPQPAVSQGDTMSPEEQVIAIEVNRELTKAQVQQGKLPPPPPTIMTPSGSAGVDTPMP